MTDVYKLKAEYEICKWFIRLELINFQHEILCIRTIRQVEAEFVKWFNQQLSTGVIEFSDSTRQAASKWLWDTFTETKKEIHGELRQGEISTRDRW